MIVVVALELAEHGCGVALIDDQDVVEQFTADSADEALGDRVRSRCPNLWGSRTRPGDRGALSVRGRRASPRPRHPGWLVVEVDGEGQGR